MPTLGKFIRQRRIELGMTQEELAERVGDNARQADISRIENDHVTLPRRARLSAIADALDVPVGALLARSGWEGAEAIRSDPPVSLSTGVVRLLEDVSARGSHAAERREVIDDVLPELEETVNQVHDLVHHAEQVLDATRKKVDDLNEAS